MSRLGTALHGMPMGSLMTPALSQDQRRLNTLFDAAIKAEVERAKELQRIYPNLSWGAAIRAVSNGYVIETMRPTAGKD